MKRITTKAALLLLTGYRRLVSPMLPHACRYLPTCSEYAMEAIERFGLVRGTAKAMGRLMRCHPLAGSGFDPVVPLQRPGCSPVAGAKTFSV